MKLLLSFCIQNIIYKHTAEFCTGRSVFNNYLFINKETLHELFSFNSCSYYILGGWKFNLAYDPKMMSTKTDKLYLIFVYYFTFVESLSSLWISPIFLYQHQSQILLSFHASSTERKKVQKYLHVILISIFRVFI